MRVKEWRTGLQRNGPPNLQPSQPPGSQFQSVYWFPHATAMRIQAQGNMKNLEGLDLWTDTLLVDIDQPENIPPALEILRDIGCGWEMWTTGNRGAHFHIPHNPLEGTDVIYSQIQWMKSVGLWLYVFPSHDHWRSFQKRNL